MALFHLSLRFFVNFNYKKNLNNFCYLILNFYYIFFNFAPSFYSSPNCDFLYLYYQYHKLSLSLTLYSTPLPLNRPLHPIATIDMQLHYDITTLKWHSIMSFVSCHVFQLSLCLGVRWNGGGWLGILMRYWTVKFGSGEGAGCGRRKCFPCFNLKFKEIYCQNLAK